MSDLFAKLENDRFMNQDGTSVYKYYEQNAFKRAYRTAVDMMHRPEFLTPIATSFVGAAAATLGVDTMFGVEAGLKNGSSTFVLSTMLGLVGGMLPDQFLFNFQRPLGIVHSYFDKRPEKDGINDEDKNAARKMKRLHSMFAVVSTSAVAVAGVTVGITPEFFGAAAAIIVSPLVHRSRYAKVEREEWGFYDFRGGPPRGKKMPEKEQRPVIGAVVPNLIR